MTFAPIPPYPLSSAMILARLPQLAEALEMDEAGWRTKGIHLVSASARRHPILPFPTLEEGTVRVRVDRMDAVIQGLQKLQKKAATFGLPAPRIETVGTEDLPVVAFFQDETGTWYWARTGEIRSFVVLRPSIEPVRLPGYTFAAVIEHLGEDGNILRTSPTFTAPLPVSYRTDPPTCDHCRTLRRRISTFVLSRDDGTFVRVGRNCLTDYLGDQSAASVVAMAVIEASLSGLCTDEWGGEGSGGWGSVQAASPVTFLSVVAMVIQTIGWASRKMARETQSRATCDLAWRVLFPPPGKIDAEERSVRNAEVTDAHRADAEAALQWARDIATDTDSDFLHNCRVVAGMGAWTSERIGIGAAILMSFQKEQERLKRIQFERHAPSAFYGTVGARYGTGKGRKALPEISATVLGVHGFNGDYGLTTIVRMQATSSSSEGAVQIHDLVWFASGKVTVTTDLEAIAAHAKNMETYEEARIVWMNANDAVRNAWYASPTGAFPHYEDFVQSDAGRAFEEKAQALCVAYKAAEEALAETELAAREATRPVQAGDPVAITGTVKAHKVNVKTNRPETVLSRCALRLIPLGESS